MIVNELRDPEPLENMRTLRFTVSTISVEGLGFRITTPSTLVAFTLLSVTVLPPSVGMVWERKGSLETGRGDETGRGIPTRVN